MFFIDLHVADIVINAGLFKAAGCRILPIMKMRQKAYFLEKVNPDFLKILNDHLSEDTEFSYGENGPKDADFDILISGIPTKEDLEASPNLKKLIIPWAGLPQRTGKLLEDYQHIEIYNLHYNAPIVAENAITLMLSIIKRIVVIDQSFRTNDWRNRYLPLNPMLLKNKRVTLLGYGAIAKEIEKRLTGWETPFTRVKRTATAGCETIDKLDQILPATDILFITVPHTEMTNNLLNQKRLALLPDNATVINLARGPVVDEKALYEELKSGRLMAGLDVWYNYPKTEEEQKACPPSQYNFAELKNVVMTPHMAGHSDRSDEYLAEALARLLNKIAEGDSTTNRVYLENGY